MSEMPKAPVAEGPVLTQGGHLQSILCRTPYDVSEHNWNHWWARQDSNLQPDRYERRANDRLRWFCFIFVRIQSRSSRSAAVVSGAKLVQLPDTLRQRDGMGRCFVPRTSTSGGVDYRL